jgi:hypothetical protein
MEGENHADVHNRTPEVADVLGTIPWERYPKREGGGVGTMDPLMDLFGPWFPWLMGVGAVLLVGGLLAKEMAADSFVRKLGHGAASAGWRLILLAIVGYVLILALGAVFDSFMSNLPGT